MQAPLASRPDAAASGSCRSPRHRFQRHRSRKPGARIMNGFTAEEFEPDPATQPAHTAPVTLRRTPTATTPATQEQRQRWKHRGEHAAGGARRERRQHRWPALDAAAYHGLAGEVVTTLAAADRSRPGGAAVAVSRLFWQRGRPRPALHGRERPAFPNLFVLLAGETAKARKGLSAGRIRTSSTPPIPTGRANASPAA